MSLGHRLTATALQTALLLLVTWSSPCASQGFSLGTSAGQPLRGVVLEQDEVLERVSNSFARHARHALESAQFSGASERTRDAARALVRNRSVDFELAVKRTLNDLAGDGVLHAAEVVEHLEPLRAKRSEELLAAIDAVMRGYAPPPLARDFRTSGEFPAAMLRYVLFERNSPARLVGAAAMIIGGLALAWSLRRAFIWGARRFNLPFWLRMAGNAVSRPLYVSAALSGLLIGLTWVWIPGIAKGGIDEATHAFVIFLSFWLLWNLANAIGKGVAVVTEKLAGLRFGSHHHLVVNRVLRVVLISMFALVLVHQILDSDLTGLLAGLGVLGIALSFALRGTIENVAASFTIFGDEPFKVGDVLIYSGLWGTVEDIGFRSTRLRTFDKHLITIPNSSIVDAAVHNVGARTAIRRRFRIGLTFDTPPDKIRQAIEIVEDIITDDHTTAGDQPRVVFESFGDYDLRLLIQYYYRPADYWQALAFDTKVNLAIIERFASAGIEIAFPTMTSKLIAEDLPSFVADTETRRRNDESEAESDDRENPREHQHGDESPAS